MAFFQFVILLDSVEIDGSHVVELARKLGNQVLKIIIGRRWGSHVGAFQLRPQYFFVRERIRNKLSQIDLIALRHMFRQMFSLELQLRLPDRMGATLFL